MRIADERHIALERPWRRCSPQGGSVTAHCLRSRLDATTGQAQTLRKWAYGGANESACTREHGVYFRMGGYFSETSRNVGDARGRSSTGPATDHRRCRLRTWHCPSRNVRRGPVSPAERTQLRLRLENGSDSGCKLIQSNLVREEQKLVLRLCHSGAQAQVATHPSNAVSVPAADPVKKLLSY